MDNYFNKYLKYRNKYLLLKLNQNGGSKIFDLSQDYQFNNEVQENLKKLYQEFGNNFIIQSKKINLSVPVSLKKLKYYSGLEFYQLSYYEEKPTNVIKPFKIKFYDALTNELNNNSHLVNLSKTDKISGTKMMDLVLEINKKLGVKKISLSDAASVECEGEIMSLSFIKLLEYEKTFYMKLGFDFDISTNQMFKDLFKTEKELKKKIKETIKRIRQIKTIEIRKEMEKTVDLLNMIIKNGDYENLEIQKMESYYPELELLHYNGSKNKVREILQETMVILDAIKDRKDRFLYTILIDLFKNDCYVYLDLYFLLIENSRYQLQYKNQKIIRKYIIDFNFLINIIKYYKFSINL
jgi:hypothetical protein